MDCRLPPSPYHKIKRSPYSTRQSSMRGHESTDISAFERTLKNFGRRYKRLQADQQTILQSSTLQAGRPASLFRYWVDGKGKRQEQAVGHFTPFGRARWDANGNRIMPKKSRCRCLLCFVVQMGSNLPRLLYSRHRRHTRGLLTLISRGCP